MITTESRRIALVYVQYIVHSESVKLCPFVRLEFHRVVNCFVFRFVVTANSRLSNNATKCRAEFLLRALFAKERLSTMLSLAINLAAEFHRSLNASWLSTAWLLLTTSCTDACMQWEFQAIYLFRARSYLSFSVSNVYMFSRMTFECRSTVFQSVVRENSTNAHLFE